MRILLLGGTVFLGRALTDAALARGHRVAHFNRGQSAPADPRVETLNGDRTQSLEALAGRSWDAIVDTSGYLPRVVERSARFLRGAARRYLFVSSISVYAGPRFDEEAPVLPPPDPIPEAMTPETYGSLKALCESAARDAFGDDALVVRPGLIVGPFDPTDRFTWWAWRIAKGGRVAAPGRPARTVQFIDVRDLARCCVALLESDARGTYNATGPREPLAMSRLLEACRVVSRSDAIIEWIDEATLARCEIAPWKEMPLWIPESDPHAAGFMSVPIARALAAGLAFTPIEQTIADTLAWARTRPADHAWKAGLSAEREKELVSGTH